MFERPVLERMILKSLPAKLIADLQCSSCTNRRIRIRMFPFRLRSRK